MGQSTDGILAYGWNLGDGEDEDNDWASEFLEELAEKYDGDVDAIVLAKLGYDGPDEYKPQAEFLKSVTFEIITHCSCDYPMYILTLKDANWSASRGYPQNLTEALDILSNHALLDGMLYGAASNLGLNPPQGPTLLLASLWC